MWQALSLLQQSSSMGARLQISLPWHSSSTEKTRHDLPFLKNLTLSYLTTTRYRYFAPSPLSQPPSISSRDVSFDWPIFLSTWDEREARFTLEPSPPQPPQKTPNKTPQHDTSTPDSHRPVCSGTCLRSSQRRYTICPGTDWAGLRTGWAPYDRLVAQADRTYQNLSICYRISSARLQAAEKKQDTLLRHSLKMSFLSLCPCLIT